MHLGPLAVRKATAAVAGSPALGAWVAQAVVVAVVHKGLVPGRDMMAAVAGRRCSPAGAARPATSCWREACVARLKDKVWR